MNNQLDAIDSGSNYQFGDKMLQSTFPRSGFILSHDNDISFPPESNGMLIPILTLRTVPTDSFTLNVDSVLRVLPQVVPLYSRQRMYIHAFYCRGADLWRSWNIFASKGYNGKRNLTIPTLNADVCPDAQITSDSLFHYLYDLPLGFNISDFYGKISLLPAMMYFKIWRDYFCNKNFYLEDSSLLPDDDADFRLDNDGHIISDPDFNFDLTEWRYRDFSNDRFNTCFPSPQRGDAQKIDIPLESTFRNLVLDTNTAAQSLESVKYTSSYDHSSTVLEFGLHDDDYSPEPGVNRWNQLQFSDSGASSSVDLAISGNLGVDLTDGIKAIGITLEALRSLAINQTELEKMAHTDGSYREFGLTFFGQVSKTAIDYRPVYIGGTYQPIVYTEVLQTSASTEDSPLGTYGGHGISSNNGYLGSIDCDDYGFIMVLASVMPDTYYSQGLRKDFTDLTQADLLLPDRAKLGMQAVLNQEIYFSNDEDVDSDLFGYQDIYDEYRYMPNVVHGALADPSQLEFFPYTQSRYFESLPTLSQSFATTKDNVRMDFLTGPEFIPYTAKFGFSIRAVRPLPYRAVPASII